MVIQLLNIIGKIVREHFVDSVLVAVSNGSIVVPALKAEHIKRLLKTLNFLLRFFSDFQKALAFADRTNCPRRTIA